MRPLSRYDLRADMESAPRLYLLHYTVKSKQVRTAV